MATKFTEAELVATIEQAFTAFKGNQEVVPSDKELVKLARGNGDVDAEELWFLANSIQKFSNLKEGEKPTKSDIKWFRSLTHDLKNRLESKRLQIESFQVWLLLRMYLLYVDGGFALEETQEIPLEEIRAEEEKLKRNFLYRNKYTHPELFETDELNPDQIHTRDRLQADKEMIIFRRSFDGCVPGLEYVEYQSQKRYFRISGEVIVFPNSDRVVDLLFLLLANYEDKQHFRDRTGLFLADVAYELKVSPETIERNISYLKNSLKILHEKNIYITVKKSTQNNRYWLEISDQPAE
jgi:hypothetical protein